MVTRYALLRFFVIALLFIPPASAEGVYKNFEPMHPEQNYYDEDYYHECKLQTIKSGMDGRAIAAIDSACKHKATPKKCRTSLKQNSCLDECKEAGYWSNKFGECSKG